MTMQRRITGRKINYRPMIEAELSAGERERVYSRQDRAAQQFGMKEAMLQSASADLVDAMPESARWFCLQVWSGREFAVEKSLADAKVTTLVPRDKGQFRIRKGVRVDAPDRPYFPGYILVHCVPTADAFLGLKQVEHVLDIVGGDSGYHVVRDEDVEIFRMIGDGEAPRIAADKTFVDGDRADIVLGPFAGFMCLVIAVKWCRQPSARVAIDCGGKVFEIESMPLVFLKKL
ncbi:transcription termination/antitermination protein NusG [Neorhizobium petrolearium]|uniref:Transcription termination/antitermination NusG family protein n=1 Tax=Neorhizobium petrolearium TaxID=515361 RepID=A0ABY8M269_9HYPH|nr:transcription termination/antitermination NusG family protein [Neorhizobium petrolearium]MCC2608377.1 antitermination protein NusG [Neorhizobium petrolearium]WGI68656.1 transcription termination/antitermination NusG family protein [Neorhizobium petrolearium]